MVLLFYVRSRQWNLSGKALENQRPSSAEYPDPEPRDDLFMELLFGAMCRNIAALPGEAFVDRARRWTAALSCAASLKPSDQQEWLRAADVTMAQFFAVYSLVMRDRHGISATQRLKHGEDFVLHTKAMRDAWLRYDRLRNFRAA
jgi:hypothetical protein